MVTDVTYMSIIKDAPTEKGTHRVPFRTPSRGKQPTAQAFLANRFVGFATQLRSTIGEKSCHSRAWLGMTSRISPALTS